jgi:hypothetical protein
MPGVVGNAEITLYNGVTVPLCECERLDMVERE